MVEPLDVHVELFTGQASSPGFPASNGWLDVTNHTRGAPSAGGVRISRGTAAEGQRPSPGSATMLINNHDGRYSPRNAEGPLYGLIGRNTPIRVYVDFPAPTLRSVSTSTPGDVEDFTVTAPAGIEPGDTILAFQSFATFPVEEDLRLPEGGSGWQLAQIATNPSGTNILGVIWRKIALFNEPASYTFYNPDGGEAVVAILAIEGAVMDPPGFLESAFSRELAPATLVETPLIAPAGIADLEVRWAAGVPVGAGVTWTPPAGFTEQADLNDGNAVTGSVATRALTSNAFSPAVDFTASGSVDDGHGLAISVPSRSYRFNGEVSEWPPRASCGDGNLWVPITGSGPLRRLNQGSEPISSMRKLYEDLEANLSNVLWAYWPLEDGSNATAPLSGMENGPLMVLTGDIQFGASSRLFGSSAVAVFQSNTRVSGVVPAATSGDISTSVDIAFGGNEPDNGAILTEVRAAGTVAIWRVIYGTGFQFTMSGYDEDGVLIGSGSTIDLSATADVNQRFLIVTIMTQSGANANFSLNVTTLDDDYLVTQNGSGSSLAGETVGTVKQIRVGTGLTNVAVGHIGVGDIFGVATSVDEAIIGYFGEQAATRIGRLLIGTGVGFSAELSPLAISEFPVAGQETGTTPMGEEPVDTLVNKIQQAVATDRGVLYEDRGRLRLIYKAPDALYNQSPTAPLEYGDLGAPLDPMDDDLLLANDITVTQVNGSQARVVKTTGPLSIQTPPTGVGTYTGGDSVNAASDLILPDIANWLLRLGTWDDFRFDRINIRNLAILDCPINPPLVRFAAALDPGDVISIDDLPDWLPPDLIRQLVRGSEEFLDKYDWSMSFNTVPAGPYDVGILAAEGGIAPGGGSPEPDAPMRFSSQGSITAGGMLLSGAAGAYASTPDHASLDITGDIDIRFDGINDNWASGSEQTLVAKYADSTGQRSYRFAVNGTGTLRLQWSTDGTATASRSTTVVPDAPPGGRLIVRVTMDVNDGAGNRVVSFYTAPSETGNVIDGPWTLLEQFTTAGTTSIFNSSAALEVGARDSGATARFTGLVHEAAVYSGIAGTLVTSPDFTDHTQGTTSFVDNQGRTWTVNGAALVLGAFLAGTDTTLYVTTILGPLWTQNQNGDFDLRVSGARLRVTAIGAPVGMTQPFTVNATVVNGIEKSIAGGTEVVLWAPAAFAK